MRVITGIAKGRNLKPLKGLVVRPTSDKVRGAIFNMLGAAILDANVLDLFSGTGALGIEALSRGAKDVVFVDDNFQSVNIIKENLRQCGFNGEVIKNNARKTLEKLEKNIFNIVFADPPYGKDLARNLLFDLNKCSILKNFAFVVIEHSKRDIIEETAPFKKIQEKRYGDTVVSVYKYMMV